jgi:hypothetical protein
MNIKRFHCLFTVLLFCFTAANAQYRATITNLNNKEVYELKINEAFYFATLTHPQKIKGTLTSVGANELIIDGKSYKTNEISWIDDKGKSPKKKAAQRAKVLAYLGAGFLGAGVYEYAQANDKKTGQIIGATGAVFTLGALCFWLLPKQPKYDFTTNYLLEIAPQLQEKK